MRSIILALCAVVMAGATGCAKFDGEWLEVGRIEADGTVTPSEGRRWAVKFSPPSLVQNGIYLAEMDVVDANTVQSEQYFLYDGWTVAHFGSVVARYDGEYLIAAVSGGQSRKLARVKGKSIFPPRVRIPELGRATQPPAAEQLASAAP
jgi:hypothetical protein